ncbi:hypothetical protein [Streptomyces sp. NPDC046712]|uniref:trypsin-like serine peptidase n=1 Tax=Streptomyces sp. NPDC046712 TaxID=3154802 RepID=UPI0033D71D90
MRLHRAAAVAACSAALLGGLLTPSATAQDGAAKPPAPTNSRVDKHVSTQSVKEIKAYWTPERTREALANPEPMLKAGPKREKADRLPATPSGANLAAVTAVADAARPATSPQISPVAATSSTTSTAETSSTASAAATEVAVAQDVPYSTSIPNVVVGKLFFTKPDGTNGTCTASVIVSNNKNTLWTAGHCVHLGTGGGGTNWFTNIEFVPGYKGDGTAEGQRPWGTWYYDHLYAPNDWTAYRDYQEGDMAAVVLKPDSLYGNIQDAIGALGYQFGNVTDYDDVFSVGYPGEGYHRTDMDAERMMYCRGNTEDADPWWPTDDRLKIDCDMGKGASGGPMFIGLLAYNPQIIGSNSHVHEDATTGERVTDDLFSATHDANAVGVINTVNGA